MEQITLENITKDQIVEMAKYIQQLETSLKEHKGYIMQLETMIQQRNSQLKKANELQPSIGVYTRFEEVKSNIDL